MLLGGIFEFDSPIPQSSANAATGAEPITAIVKHQRCISAYKFFAAPETAAAVRPRNYQSQPVGKSITQQCTTGEEILWNGDLIRVRCNDAVIAAGQDHYFGHFRFRIEPDEVGGEAGFGHGDVGARVTAASGSHSIVYRGEFVET